MTRGASASAVLIRAKNRTLCLVQSVIKLNYVMFLIIIILNIILDVSIVELLVFKFKWKIRLNVWSTIVWIVLRTMHHK